MNPMLNPPTNPRLVEVVCPLPWAAGSQEILYARYFRGGWWVLDVGDRRLKWTLDNDYLDYATGWRELSGEAQS